MLKPMSKIIFVNDKIEDDPTVKIFTVYIEN